MSNFVYEDAINWAYDRLRDAQGVGQPLAYVKHVLLGDHHELDFGADGIPAIIVRLQDPERDEQWSMTADATRDSAMAIVIEMAIYPEDLERPYGIRGGGRGYLTLVSDVGNVLESHAEWPAFGPADTGPAFDATYQGLGHTFENDLYIGRALLIPTLRFTAGSR